MDLELGCTLEGVKMINSIYIIYYYLFFVLLVLWIYLLAYFFRRSKNAGIGKYRYFLLVASLLVLCNDIAIMVIGKLYKFNVNSITNIIQTQLNVIIIAFVFEMLAFLALFIYISHATNRKQTKV